MKHVISLFMAMALTALMAVSSNVLASDAQDNALEVIEQDQQVVVEEGKEMAVEPVMEAEGAPQEVEQAVENVEEAVEEHAAPTDK